MSASGEIWRRAYIPFNGLSPTRCRRLRIFRGETSRSLQDESRRVGRHGHVCVTAKHRKGICSRHAAREGIQRRHRRSGSKTELLVCLDDLLTCDYCQTSSKRLCNIAAAWNCLSALASVGARNRLSDCSSSRGHTRRLGYIVTLLLSAHACTLGWNGSCSTLLLLHDLCFKANLRHPGRDLHYAAQN